MATRVGEVGEFTLIIVEADAARAREAASAFAKAFSLEEPLANQILASAPIVFASNLTKSEVKGITPKLTEVSGFGVEFRITAKPVARIPRVHWPMRPLMSDGTLAFEWENAAFVCPGCGETFVFKRLGKLKLKEEPGDAPVKPAAETPAVSAILEAEAPTFEPASAPAAVVPVTPAMVPPVVMPVARPAASAERIIPLRLTPPAPAPAAAEEPLRLPEDLPVMAPEPLPADQEAQFEGLQLPGEGESLDLPEGVEEVKIEEAPLAPEEPERVEPLQEAFQPAPPVVPPPPPPPVPMAMPVSRVAPSPMRPAAPAAPARAAGSASVPAGPAPALSKPVTPAAPAPSESEGGEPAGAPEGGEAYNVFLSKISDRARQEKAAELISKVKGCPLEEAKGLTTRLVIPIAKNVTKEQAEGILGEFKKIKIFGRMTRVK